MVMSSAGNQGNLTDLSGRSAIVTGGGSGIGQAIALTLARCGASVMVNDFVAERADETVAMIHDAGGEAVAAVASVADENQVAGFVADAMERWGKIDILCSNAGLMCKMEYLEDTSTEMWNRIMGVNATGTFFVLRAVLPHMRKAKNGSIIVTSSAAGLRGGAAGPVYTASKHAAVGLTRNVAWYYGKDGIRCNAICPGATETNITGGLGLDMFDKEGLGRVLPIMSLCERIGEAQALADVAVFLASDAARHMNGVILPVDGGWMAG
jgi:NAD(P)-dependent dehydrogenase (short-subunit alcohol dehydrogenase family)